MPLGLEMDKEEVKYEAPVLMDGQPRFGSEVHSQEMNKQSSGM